MLGKGGQAKDEEETGCNCPIRWLVTVYCYNGSNQRIIKKFFLINHYFLGEIPSS